MLPIYIYCLMQCPYLPSVSTSHITCGMQLGSSLKMACSLFKINLINCKAMLTYAQYIIICLRGKIQGCRRGKVRVKCLKLNKD